MSNCFHHLKPLWPFWIKHYTYGINKVVSVRKLWICDYFLKNILQWRSDMNIEQIYWCESAPSGNLIASYIGWSRKIIPVILRQANTEKYSLYDSYVVVLFTHPEAQQGSRVRQFVPIVSGFGQWRGIRLEGLGIQTSMSGPLQGCSSHRWIELWWVWIGLCCIVVEKLDWIVIFWFILCFIFSPYDNSAIFSFYRV